MPQHTTAIFENGNLKLVNPLKGIPDHAVVKIVVENITPPSTEKQLAMLREVPIASELADIIEAERNKRWKVEEF